MIFQLFNWRTLLAIIAIAIVTGTIFYSNHLAKKIAQDEKIKVEHWVAAEIDITNPNTTETALSSSIVIDNSKDIPMIAVTEKDSIFDYYNLDSSKIKKDKNYLLKKLTEFKETNQPIEWRNPLDSSQVNKVYYGDSKLLKEVKYYPIVQLLIVTLFIIITLMAVAAKNKSTQNQVWAGMAKETAHQLGTPLSSLQGWVEMMKENAATEKIAAEMTKDVERLKLVSDRFSKIGSTPQLERCNIITQVEKMVTYIKRRSTDKVNFSMNYEHSKEIVVPINAPLFEWVIENLLKNALDAMDGIGNIVISIKQDKNNVLIDVTDDGKGISKTNISKVFKPGFTTKKRGWGLGLSLSKRIIETYHKGKLFVKNSEMGKGTTFRILLKK